MQNPSIKNLFSKNTIPVPTIEHIRYLQDLEQQQVLSKSLFDPGLKNEFLNSYFHWIQSSSLNRLEGISSFSNLSYVHGTSQAFDLFYAANNGRRFRCFKGEFIYHRLSWRNNYSFKFIEDGELTASDAMVMSLPFSNTGNVHPDAERILSECEEKNIPVLIDCAYYGIARNIFFNLNYSCIKVITFSLSKIFYGLDRFRIGIRCKRNFDDDPIDVFNSYDMFNKPGAAVGLEFIKHYPADYNQQTYHAKQLEICAAHNLTASNCVIFGLSTHDYPEFNRGGDLNRVCISNALVN
ncbi:MAG TPA: aminotransferase class I/II-fold pyridoxal phosphate-dependent enzyme [Chitinophagaceae bacterium]|nr:aminotransferase class I/II-fold pyridoxal phosphate-dependent enzyme [Chitinophagaceae bacterium]